MVKFDNSSIIVYIVYLFIIIYKLTVYAKCISKFRHHKSVTFFVLYYFPLVRIKFFLIQRKCNPLRRFILHNIIIYR